MAEPTWQDAVAEVWQRFKETDHKIAQLSGLFSSQWGKLLEALVQPAALRLVQERGIQVHHVYQRVKSHLNGHIFVTGWVGPDNSIG